MPFDPEFWTQMWGDFVASAMAWLPRLVGAVVWLLWVGGWLAWRSAHPGRTAPPGGFGQNLRAHGRRPRY